MGSDGQPRVSDQQSTGVALPLKQIQYFILMQEVFQVFIKFLFSAIISNVY